jgi:hypothetical protein
MKIINTVEFLNGLTNLKKNVFGGNAVSGIL